MKKSSRCSKPAVSRSIPHRHRLDLASYWQQLFDEMPEGLMILDEAGRIVCMNRELAQRMAVDPRKAQGKPCEACMHRTQRAPANCPHPLVMKTGIPCTLEIRDKKSDLNCHVSVRPLRDESDRLIGTLHVSRDITAQKHYEEALQQKEQVLNALLNNIPDIACLKDRRSRFIAVNEAYAQACGRKPEELIGKTDLDIWPRELALHYRKYDRLVKKSRKPIKHEEPLADRNGHIKWIEVIKTPIMDTLGHVMGLAAIARDITPHKMLKEKLRVSEEQIRSALQERERLARDLHDQTIQSLYALGLELEMNAHRMPRAARKIRDKLHRSVADLNKIIRDLRAFITDVRIAAHPAIRLEQEIRGLVERIRKTRAVKLQTRIDATACRQLDPFQRTHVLNIVREAVSNCLKHARARRIDLSIRCRRKRVVIAIRDDGRGMKPPKNSSRGLGLSNIYSRVAEMNGQVKIESREGKGTRIQITLGEGPEHEF